MNPSKMLCLILALVMAAGLFASCAGVKDSQPDNTSEPVNIPTETVSESPTAAPTQAPQTEPVLIDNKTQNVSVIAEIVSGDVVKGSESLGSNAPIKKHNSRLCIPYDSKASYGIGITNWTTWGFSDTFFSDNYVRSQISADVFISSSGTGQWMGPLFGLFKNDTDAIADTCTDGMYISFNSAAYTVTAYIPDADNWNWPEGNATVSVSPDLLKKQTHIDILVTNNKTVYVYLKNTLVMTVAYGSQCSVTDGSGKTVYTGPYDKNLISGDKFSIFSHCGGVGIGNMKLYVQREENAPEPTKAPVGNVGLDITDKTDLVGICYTMWFNAIHGNGTSDISDYPHNVTEYINKYGSFTKEEGFGEGHNNMTYFHYWAKPAQGYYRSSDKQAHRNNLDLIGKADVDFLILDYTFATGDAYSPGTSAWKTYIYLPSVALLDTIVEMRAEGKKVPYVVFWVNDNTLFDAFKSYFLNQDKWKDCFVYWDEKPFVLTWMYKKSYLDDDLTIYGMYGLQGKATENQWSYLEVNNAKTSTKNHISVSVATQETYMSYPTAHGRNGGKFWYNQWVNAFKTHPKIVTVTWWNEWCAQLYYFDGAGYVFTDNFNEEYSRDIEPMEGGHGDQYYKWLCSYVKAYKNGEECPKNYN